MQLSEVESAKESERISEAERRFVNIPRLVMMNLAMMVAGSSNGWNHFLYIGAGEYLVSYGICSLAYLCLGLCIAEMASAISFSGGSFGYVRCTLSPMLGFFVGLCDLIQSVFYTAIYAELVAKALAEAAEGMVDSAYLPLYILLVYVTAVLVTLPGGSIFWNITVCLAAASVAVTLLFCLTSAPGLNFNRFAVGQGVGAFEGSARDFFAVLMMPMSYYVGCDHITLFGDEAVQPERTLPRAMLIALTITVLLGWWSTVSIISIAPGISNQLMSRDTVFPMSLVFADRLGIGHRGGALLSLAQTLSLAVAFLFAAGRQVNAMARSKLLPHWLTRTMGDRKVPIAAILSVALTGYVILLFKWGFTPGRSDLLNLCMGSACLVYVCMLWAYVVFRLRYSSMERTFSSPLGIPGALFGVTYFVLLMMTMFVGQDGIYAFCVWCLMQAIGAVYYFKVAQKRQFFSKDEQLKFMKAYILNANRRKKHHANVHPILKSFLSLLSFVEMGGLNQHGSRFGSGSGTSSPRGSHAGNSSPRSHASGSKGGSPRTHAQSAFTAVEGSSSEVVPVSTSSPSETVPSLVPSLNLRIDTALTISRLQEMPVTEGDAHTHTLKHNTVLPVVSASCPADQHRERRERAAGGLVGSLRRSMGNALSFSHRVSPADPVEWSGRVLSERESRRFFEVVNGDGEDSLSRSAASVAAALLQTMPDTARDSSLVADDLVKEFPAQFTRKSMMMPPAMTLSLAAMNCEDELRIAEIV